MHNPANNTHNHNISSSHFTSTSCNSSSNSLTTLDLTYLISSINMPAMLYTTANLKLSPLLKGDLYLWLVMYRRQDQEMQCSANHKATLHCSDMVANLIARCLVQQVC